MKVGTVDYLKMFRFQQKLWRLWCCARFSVSFDKIVSETGKAKGEWGLVNNLRELVENFWTSSTGNEKKTFEKHVSLWLCSGVHVSEQGRPSLACFPNVPTFSFNKFIPYSSCPRIYNRALVQRLIYVFFWKKMFMENWLLKKSLSKTVFSRDLSNLSPLVLAWAESGVNSTSRA